MIPASFQFHPLASAAWTDWVVPALAGFVVLVLLPLMGWRELRRLSPRRIWALSQVCFHEALRRRVLWITPLAIIGVVAVCQLTSAVDAQDAIRQVIKYSMFASGLVVTLAIIIMACSSLPKEIDTRVIYTVVTKPATRLEIILGKVLGFWRVAGAILLIMGAFTYVYVLVNAGRLHHVLAVELKDMSPQDSAWATKKHYQESGLLEAKNYALPEPQPQVYDRLPTGTLDPSTTRWMLATPDADIMIPFDLPSEFMPLDAQHGEESDENAGAPEAAQPTTQISGDEGIQVRDIKLQVVAHNDTAADFQILARPTTYSESNVSPLIAPATQPLASFPLEWPGVKVKRPMPPGPVRCSVSIAQDDLYTVIAPSNIKDSSFDLPFTDKTPTPTVSDSALRLLGAVKPGTTKRIYVRLHFGSPASEVGVSTDACTLYSPRLQKTLTQAVGADGKPLAPILCPAFGGHGQTLRGGPEGYRIPTAAFAFRGISPVRDATQVPFELRVNTETNSESRSHQEELTDVEVQAYNLDTNELGPPQILSVESNRTVYFGEPANLVQGNFDLLLRGRTLGHSLAMSEGCLQMVHSRQSFVLNLIASLGLLWLFALLTIMIAVFCSTFVSWPIAVVLTVVLLLGHWPIAQVGDTSKASLSRSVVSDLFKGADPKTAEVVSSSMEALAREMRIVSAITPDISEFAVVDYISRGVMVPGQTVLGAMKVTLEFGIPLIAMAFLVLKRKEVAP